LSGIGQNNGLQRAEFHHGFGVILPILPARKPVDRDGVSSGIQMF
jgi:hypothetical protein